MAKLVNIGFGNVVNSEKLLAVVSPDAAPIKRLVTKAKEEGRVIDATQGRRTKAVVVLEGGRILLSALQPETISRRFNSDYLVNPDSVVREEKEESEADDEGGDFSSCVRFLRSRQGHVDEGAVEKVRSVCAFHFCDYQTAEAG